MIKTSKVFGLAVFFLIIQTKYTICYSQQLTPKDTIVTVFFNSQIQPILDADSNQASYYRVIKYRDGNIFGAVNDFYKNGKIIATTHYLDNNPRKGFENGRFIWYFENGMFFQICNYTNGIVDGPFIEFDSLGNKRGLAILSNGVKNGCEYFWDEKEKVIKKSFYENGTITNNGECDERGVDSLIASEKKSSFDSWNDNNFQDKDFTTVKNIIHYLSNTAKISDVSFPQDFKDSNSISPTFKIEGFKRINGLYSYNYFVSTDFDDDKNFQTIVQRQSSTKSDSLYFNFIYKKPKLYNGAKSVHLTITFYLFDNNSEAVITGYFALKYLL